MCFFANLRLDGAILPLGRCTAAEEPGDPPLISTSITINLAADGEAVPLARSGADGAILPLDRCTAAEEPGDPPLIITINPEPMVTAKTGDDVSIGITLESKYAEMGRNRQFFYYSNYSHVEYLYLKKLWSPGARINAQRRARRKSSRRTQRQAVSGHPWRSGSACR